MENTVESDTPLKLLVIDDDDVDRMQLRRALVGCGYKYDLTEHGDIAAIGGLAGLSRFDCIFMDYMLPGENGLLLVQKIREEGVRTPVIIVTSQGNEGIAVKLMKAGAADYVVKNHINQESIAMVLRNVLAIRRITEERERMVEALRISESRLEDAQRIARIGNFEFTTESLHLSNQAYACFGMPEGTDVTPALLLRCVHPDDRGMALDAWREILKGQALSLDFRVTYGDGPSVRSLSVRARSYFDSAGKVTKVIGTVQDITERKDVERELLKAREVAEHSARARGTFLANMSHEIRTPMNAILGFTELLYETELTAEQRGYVDSIHFSGENLLVIINDILDISKIRSGRMTIEKCDFNMREVTNGILAVMSPKAAEKGLELTCSVDTVVPETLTGDPVRLNQILTNLISNALKFTESGSVSVTIGAKVLETDGVLVEMAVADTGIGIPEDKQAMIFDKFVQASDDTTRKFGGTGLGLTIVKHLVEMQDGKIWLASKPGSGTTFYVQIPFGRSTVHSKPSGKQAPVPSGLEKLRGAKILLAEDNSVNQLLARKVLEKAGCTVQIAANGVEALHLLQNGIYDVVLMDIQMPEMDGYETARRIREFSGSQSRIPIIAMTAHAFGSDVARSLAVGMDDYISKPFKSHELYEKILKHLGEHATVQDPRKDDTKNTVLITN